MSRTLLPANPDGSLDFALGVNYWPRRKAMRWWKAFDSSEVRADFALLGDLGLRVVRIFLLWEDFQPTPDQVSARALANLEVTADLADAHGLRLDVTFFTGHMSGPNWCPSWLFHDGPKPERVFMDVISAGRVVDQGYRNPYSDPVALGAQRLLLRAVLERLRDHPGIGAWNLGNEPDLFAWPPDAATGRAWATDLMDLARELDPVHPVTCGLHAASLVEDNGLRVHEIFERADFATMHSYPMYSSWARGKLDPWFVPFTCALTAALSGRNTLAEEFGACTNTPDQASATWTFTRFGRSKEQFMAGEEAYAEHLEAVLPNLVAVGATGALLWCFADYAPELWGEPPCDQSIHERFFGLLRPDGSLKPHAEVLRRFAATRPLVRPQPARRVRLDLEPLEYYRDPRRHAERLYERFLAQETA